MRIRTFILFIPALAILAANALSQEPGRVAVPMKMRGPMPAVEVMVNGKGPFLFGIDTGGQGKARADVSLVGTLDLKKVGEVMASDGSGSDPVALPIVGIDSIEIGGMKFSNIEAGSRDYNRSPRLPKIDGILGFDLFRDHLLTLDYASGQVIIAKGELPAADGNSIVSFDLSSGVPEIEISIAGKKVKAHLDSGNLAGAFMIPDGLASTLNFKGETRVVGRARTITSEMEIKQGTLDGTILLGGIEFKDPDVTFPALRDANVGSRALAGLSLTFDQKNGRLKVERPAQ